MPRQRPALGLDKATAALWYMREVWPGGVLSVCADRLELCESADRAFDGGAHVKTGVDGEPVQEQSVAERHEGPGRWHGVGDAEGDHHLLSPPLELVTLSTQRLAELRIAGEFEKEREACAGARGERPRL